jgi:hypothetical protein
MVTHEETATVALLGPWVVVPCEEEEEEAVPHKEAAAVAPHKKEEAVVAASGYSVTVTLPWVGTTPASPDHPAAG